MIECLRSYDIEASGCRDAPGVYVGDAKICSIGLRIKKGRAYHGIALNVDMDLSPFQRINPCGYANMPMTQIKDFQPSITLTNAQQSLEAAFLRFF